MRYAPEHKEKTRSLVLREASQAIRKEGPHRVSLASVMKRAGLTHGGFYAHFESRDAMLVAAIEKMFHSGRDRWVRETLDRTPAQGLTSYIDWYLSKAHRDDREGGCPIAALASDLPRLSPACQKAYAEGVRRWYAAISAQLRKPEAGELAYSAVAELVGALSLSRIERDPRRSEAILTASRKSLKKRLGLGSAS